MIAEDLEKYNFIRSGGTGFYPQKRGLIAVSGREAVQFLNGLITNDVAKLEENAQMLAAFPNAQGRLLATVRVFKIDDRFLFETDAATHEKVFQNLFRFTFAGDFFVEDLSQEFTSVSVLGNYHSTFKGEIPKENETVNAKFAEGRGFIVRSIRGNGIDIFLPPASKDFFVNSLKEAGNVEISDELYEVLRIEQGIPLYGVDMDETTIVPELGLDGLISYNKGCYIGQEIIARIYFRGHIAKQLTGLIFDDDNASITAGDEIKSAEGKNAGKITSIVFSPELDKTIALGFVRYDYLAEGTAVTVNESSASVRNLPFLG